MIRRMTACLIICFITAVYLSACSSEAEPTPTATAVPATTPTPTLAAAPAVQLDETLIESLQITMMESFPVQVSAAVRGLLPNDCTTLDDVVVTRSGETFNIVLTTSQTQTGANCSTDPAPFSANAALPVLDLPAGTYSVEAGDARGSFTLEMDNTLQPEEPTAEVTLSPEVEMGQIDGRIWHDTCVGTGQPAGEELPEGCIASEETQTLVANGTEEADEEGVAGAQVSLFTGDCATELSAESMTTQSDEDGRFQFENLAAGDYCVQFDPLSETNQAELTTGVITFPVVAGERQNSVPVTLAAGETVSDINFGFDYLSLPLPEFDPETCANSIEFVTDVTIPDDTVFAPGASFTKTWRLRNNGECPWSTDYTLVYVGGDFPEEAPDPAPMPILVAPGQPIELSTTLTAPETAGTYRSNWQIADANGEPFGIDGEIGDAFWLKIVVEEDGAAGEPVDEAPGTIGGVVWEDICIATADGGPGRGCIETDDGRIIGDGTFNFGEPALADIEVTLGQGACTNDGKIAEDDIIATTTTATDGLYRFTDLPSEVYCVSIDALSENNVDLLIPGNWTYPFEGVGFTGVLLSADTERLDIDFGWEFIN